MTSRSSPFHSDLTEIFRYRLTTMVTERLILLSLDLHRTHGSYRGHLTDRLRSHSSEQQAINLYLLTMTVTETLTSLSTEPTTELRNGGYRDHLPACSQLYSV